MEDRLPEEQPIVTDANKAKDTNFKKKLELSYGVCLNDLCEPHMWADSISRAKFTVSTETGQPCKECIFVLDKPEDIKIEDEVCKHSYVFKRSKFYDTFSKQTSRLKRDLIKCWKTRGYFVDLYMNVNTSKWNLVIYWK